MAKGIRRVMAALRSAAPGTVDWGVERLDVPRRVHVTWLVRERGEKIEGLGQAPDLEWRAGLLVAPGGVVLVPVMIRIGPEVRGSIYESWIDHRLEPRALALLARQPVLVVHLVGEAGGIERSLGAPSPIQSIAADALELATAARPWSQREHLVARDEVYARYPDVMDLWRSLEPEDGFSPPRPEGQAMGDDRGGSDA